MVRDRAGALALTGFAGLVLVVVAAAFTRTPVLGAPLTAVVVAACLAIIAGLSIAQVGVLCLAAFALMASWTEITIGGLDPRLPALCLGFVLLVIARLPRRLPRLPWWLHLFALTATGIGMLRTILPVSPDYLANRYVTSEAGAALGTRPGTLNTLAYLLLNMYVVTFAVALAVAVVPKAMEWLIAAYVGGVAWSALAGYLGFIGHPWLVSLLAQPVPAGIRAMGYTNHSLKLATSCVFAIPLAMWLIARRNAIPAWVGRASLVAIPLGLYASGSRGGNSAGLIAAALGLVLLPHVRRRSHLVVGAITAGLGAIALVFPALWDNVLKTTRIGGGYTADRSDLGRAEIFVQSMRDWRESPIIGIGPRYLAEAHLLYAGLLASGGLVLFLAYVAYTVGSLRHTLMIRRIDPALGGALLATFLASLAYWTVADDLTVAPVQMVYGFLIAAMVRHELDQKIKVPRDAAPRSRAFVERPLHEHEPSLPSPADGR